MTKEPRKRPSARERLLAASHELFYRDGVHSTGIDAVIDKAGVAKGSLYYIFGGKDNLVAAYLQEQHADWGARVAHHQQGLTNPDELLLAVFDAIAEYVSLPEFRGCAFVNAAAERPAGSAQEAVTQEFRHWLRQTFTELADDSGVPDPAALIDALVVLYDGAVATASMDNTAGAAALTAKRIARLTLAAAKASTSS
ncbi:TetR/AcrR family transcriptional regulator [soil metagenome]